MTTKNMPSLKLMAESKVDGIQKATTFKIDPYKVEFEEGFNLREEGPDLDAHLNRLYVAMKAGAYVPPIDVSVIDGRILARDGHCRTRVARRLIDEGIPYQLEARQFRGNEVESVLHMIGSDQGKAFTPLEQGRGFRRLTRYGMTVNQIAERTGLHRTTIDNGLSLADAPIAVQRLITEGKIAVQVALDVLKKHGHHAKATEVLQALVDKASKAGVAKVTKKHVSGLRVPPKVAQSFVSAATTLREYINTTPKERKAMSSGGTVMVPAAVLHDLLNALAEVKQGEEL
jgi:hypothetical protein